MSEVLIKICGLSTTDTVTAALDAGADWIGLVFFPKSPRHVSLLQARELAAQARGRADVVALTVDADDAMLTGLIEMVRPDRLQLHGGESPERVATLKSRFGLQVMKAVGLTAAADLAAALPFAGVADMILFDAKPPKGAVLPGGNGVSFDWTILRDVRWPYMLSGGLSPDNVADALHISGASAVDVSSGVENAPGIKDPARIKAFIRAARA
jgi:phosphoribosylanthranilate isomerase